MKKRSPAGLKLATVLLTVIVVGLAVVCGYQSVASLLLARSLENQRLTLAEEQKLTAELVRSQQETQPLKERVSSQPGVWSWSEQLPPMMAQVARLVADSQVEAVQPAPIAENGQLIRFPLRLTLRSDLSSLTRLLQRARQQSPVLAVDQLAIRTGAQVGDPLRVELTLSSYVIVERSTGSGEP